MVKNIFILQFRLLTLNILAANTTFLSKRWNNFRQSGWYGQKQPSMDVLRKRCSENMQQIYWRTPMPKCDFNKFALQLYWNHTSAWVFSCILLIHSNFKYSNVTKSNNSVVHFFDGLTCLMSLLSVMQKSDYWFVLLISWLVSVDETSYAEYEQNYISGQSGAFVG